MIQRRDYRFFYFLKGVTVKMNEKELQGLVESVSLKYFKRPFKHQAVFNTRLKTTGGRYHLTSHHLDFNPKVIEVFGLDIFQGIVKHELCHYHLHLQNKGYRHGDKDFKMLLKEVGGLRYTPSFELKKGSAPRWVYKCAACNYIFHRKRRFNLNQFVCKACKGKLHLCGKKNIILKEA